MAAVGLFQTDGGARVGPVYEIGCPVYPKTVPHLSREHYGGRTFTIEVKNVSRENRYVQTATLNGRPLRRWWIRQQDIINGGTLVLEMGAMPYKEWAAGSPPPD